MCKNTKKIITTALIGAISTSAMSVMAQESANIELTSVVNNLALAENQNDVRNDGVEEVKGTVATKYLADYMSWFKWQEFFKNDKNIIKCRNLMVHSHTTHINSKINDFALRDITF